MKDVEIPPYEIKFTIPKKIKNSTENHEFRVRKFPGKSLSNCILMDTKRFLLDWFHMRGVAGGFLFCAIQGSKNNRIVHDRKWRNTKVIEFLRERLCAIGVQEMDSKNFLQCSCASFLVANVSDVRTKNIRKFVIYDLI